MLDRTPYTYFIAWTTLGTWYYGVRYAKNCNPLDLFNPYKTSSRVVKDFIASNGMPDIIQVRKTFTNVVSAKNHEDKVLRRMKVGHIPNCLNIKSDSFKNLDITKVKHLKGKDNPIHKTLATEEGRRAFSEAVSKGTKLGQAKSEKAQLNKIKSKERFISNNPGKNPSIETKEKMSASQQTRMKNPDNRPVGAKNGMFGKNHSDSFKEDRRITSKALRASEVFFCPICERTIKTTANFQKHLRVMHKTNEDDIRILCVDSRQQKS